MDRTYFSVSGTPVMIASASVTTSLARSMFTYAMAVKDAVLHGFQLQCMNIPKRTSTFYELCMQNIYIYIFFTLVMQMCTFNGIKFYNLYTYQCANHYINTRIDRR